MKKNQKIHKFINQNYYVIDIHVLHSAITRDLSKAVDIFLTEIMTVQRFDLGYPSFLPTELLLLKTGILGSGATETNETRKWRITTP